ncbi:MAG: hypothetical protein WEC74_07625, partial [Gammaproteobacteria bacterium]
QSFRAGARLEQVGAALLASLFAPALDSSRWERRSWRRDGFGGGLLRRPDRTRRCRFPRLRG